MKTTLDLKLIRSFKLQMPTSPFVPASMSKYEPLIRGFASIGARLEVDPAQKISFPRMEDRPFSLDIKADRRGEYFQLQVSPATEPRLRLEVLNPLARDRHLVLFGSLRSERGDVDKSHILCGHDERHWFAAALPAPVSTVRAAKEALTPPDLLEIQQRLGLRSKERARRRNGAFLRQGEWFFVPAPNETIAESSIRRREPLLRGAGSKPHVVDELARTRGETIYISLRAAHDPASRVDRSLTVQGYEALLRKDPQQRLRWVPRQRTSSVWVRGSVRHADHATLVLPFWHRVFLNTEGASSPIGAVTFLD